MLGKAARERVLSARTARARERTRRCCGDRAAPVRLGGGFDDRRVTGRDLGNTLKGCPDNKECWEEEEKAVGLSAIASLLSDWRGPSTWEPRIGAVLQGWIWMNIFCSSRRELG